MTIAKCKLCKEMIITSQHIEDKQNMICVGCLFKNFKESKLDGYWICLNCGVAVNSEYKSANEHLIKCGAELDSSKSQEIK